MSTIEPQSTAGAIDVAGELAAATAQVEAGRMLRARRHLRKVLDSDPRNLDALLLLAEVTSDRGRASETRQWLERALEVAPEDAPFLDVTEAVGLDFTHFNGMSGEYYYSEMMDRISGVRIFDRNFELRPWVAFERSMEGNPLISV